MVILVIILVAILIDILITLLVVKFSSTNAAEYFADTIDEMLIRAEENKKKREEKKVNNHSNDKTMLHDGSVYLIELTDKDLVDELESTVEKVVETKQEEPQKKKKFYIKFK